MSGEGLVPYDLQPLARMLVPYPHKRRNLRIGGVRIGSGEDAATLEVVTWDACAPGCTVPVPGASHDAGRSVTLKVPCESLPHCQYCECGSGHTFAVSEEQIRQLKGLLP
jgi:hypothetical protein